MVIENARSLESELRQQGIKAQLDARSEYTSGWKFNEWELKGVPLRINIGPRDIEKGTVELVRRDTREKSPCDRKLVVETAKEMLDKIQINLYEKARILLQNKITKPHNYAEFKSLMEDKGGFVSAGWCGRLECEKKIKEETGADIRVIPFDQAENPETCILCGKPSEKVAMFAKAY